MLRLTSIPRIAPNHRKLLAAALVAAAVIAYCVMLFSNISYAAGGSDTAGYMNLAKLLASGRTRHVIEPLRMFGLEQNATFVSIFTPIGFTWGLPGTGTMAPGYPPGMPLHIAAAAAIGGWSHAPFFVSPIAALLCAGMMFLVGRELGLSRFLSAIGASALALLPHFVSHALQPVSDIVATFWSLLAIWCALVALRRPSVALAAGAAFAIGVWVRPTGVLLAIPLAIALRLKPKLLLRGAAGALPFALALMFYQHHVYGSVFKTAYGTVSQVVSFEKFAVCFPIFAKWLTVMCTPLVFPAGLLVVFDKYVPRWHRLLLPVWFSVFLVFYCFWGPFDDWWSLRFLLPGTPALILGTLLLVRDMLRVRLTVPWGHVTRVIAAVVIAMLVGFPIYRISQYNILGTDEWESVYPESVHWAERQLPANAFLVSGALSGAFFYYSGRFSARVDQMNDENFQLLRAYAGSRGLRWYAVLSDGEPEFKDLPERLRGHWVQIGTYRNVAMWRLDW
ncbi:MAG: hypothetical protein ACXW2X_04755 [Thermoanaerobaculia bacterium]